MLNTLNPKVNQGGLSVKVAIGRFGNLTTYVTISQ